jgi:riboflavin kinase/FMN adenylyltransferase
VQSVEIVPFTKTLSLLSAEDFVSRILLEKFRVRHVIAGFDFAFGHQRGGNMERLREWLKPHGVGVTEVKPQLDDGGSVFSSSRARECLEAGDPKGAAHVLGRRWSIRGAVEKGDQRGRELGFPTANIALGDYLRPKFGVYAMRVERKGQALKGVANIGKRPTVAGAVERLEVYLLDFKDDLYGETLTVELVDFVRPERAFEGLDALKRQIAQDVEKAKTLL